MNRFKNVKKYYQGTMEGKPVSEHDDGMTMLTRPKEKLSEDDFTKPGEMIPKDAGLMDFMNYNVAHADPTSDENMMNMALGMGGISNVAKGLKFIPKPPKHLMQKGADEVMQAIKSVPSRFNSLSEHVPELRPKNEFGYRPERPMKFIPEAPGMADKTPVVPTSAESGPIADANEQALKEMAERYRADIINKRTMPRENIDPHTQNLEELDRMSRSQELNGGIAPKPEYSISPEQMEQNLKRLGRR